MSLRLVHRVKDDGTIAEAIVAEFDEDGALITEVDKDFIIDPVPQGLYLPKWTGTEWIDGMTPEEIEELNKPAAVFDIEKILFNMDFRLSMVELERGF